MPPKRTPVKETPVKKLVLEEAGETLEGLVYLREREQKELDRLSGFHLTFMCGAFIGLTAHQRLDKVKQKKVCYNCLHSGHSSRNCSSKYLCGKCKRRHHTLLHRQPPILRPSGEGQPPKMSPPQTAKPVMLPTAVVYLGDDKNRPLPCRLLLDNGSQVNFISEHMAKRINTRRVAANVPISGISARRTSAQEATIFSLGTAASPRM